MRLALALLAGAVCCIAGSAPNYCGAKMCGHSNKHTFCQYPPGPSPKCRGYMEAPLSAEEKVRVVARLNRRRSDAASGRLRNFAPAGNMLKLRWVEELAREAQRWADQCRPPATPDERDACRDLFSTSVGQCVASVVGEAPGLRVESLVDVWYMQGKHYRGNLTYYIPPMSNISFYGDFAQMIWARSYMVGCGRSRFMSEWNGRLRSVERLVCNIAPHGPPPSRPLWAPAAPTSVCPPRSVPDPDLTSLCNYQRELDASTDVDGAMTIEEHVLLSIVLEMENKKVSDYLGSLDELYMTKLAVVTMDSRITTPSYFNPMHKRDLIESLGLDGDVVHIDNVIVENDINEFLNATRIIVKIEQSTEGQTVATKKANLIGRPKSYNIEDLNSIHINLQQEMNIHDDLPRRDFAKIDKDIYMDYEFLEVSEDNVSSVTESPHANTTEYGMNTNIMVTNEFVGCNNTTESLHEPSLNSNESHLVTDQDQGYPRQRKPSINDYFANYTKSVTARMNATQKSDDDYFSDPETVRELEEALDRMEKSLSGEEKQLSIKVRRELRNRNPDETSSEAATEENIQYASVDDDSKQYILPEGYDNNVIQGGNNTDKSPMLNMVLKYLPYLKPYQKEILGSTASSNGVNVVFCELYLVLVIVLSFVSL